MNMILILLFLSNFCLSILHFKKCKALKKEINKKLMPVAWHPNRWYMSEDEKMEIDPMFNEEL